MINICTVSDINYLIKGLTLYESLLKYSKNFKLHYLCIDDQSYEIAKKHESETLIIYNVSELLSNDEILLKLKNSNYRYFCWSLASYFSNFLINKNIGDIMYIDSDILLHDDVDVILNSIGNKEIGIFRHRQFPLNYSRDEGFYNVGIVFFKNGTIGKKILNWWSDAVLNQKYPHLATCGDQKYLDEFPNMCPSDLIFIDGEIGHGAPWQWQLYDYSDYESNHNIIWEGRKQKLIFTHFSQFDFRENGYIPSTQHHIYTPIEMYTNVKSLKLIYDDYYNKLKETKIKYYN
jgi:hypothetical protein